MLIILQKDFDVELQEESDGVINECDKITVHNLSVNSDTVTIDASVSILVNDYEVATKDGDYLGAINAKLGADLIVKFKQDELVQCWFYLNSPQRIWRPQINVSNITLNEYNVIDGTPSAIDSKLVFEQLEDMLMNYYDNYCEFVLTLS